MSRKMKTQIAPCPYWINDMNSADKNYFDKCTKKSICRRYKLGICEYAQKEVVHK